MARDKHKAMKKADSGSSLTRRKFIKLASSSVALLTIPGMPVLASEALKSSPVKPKLVWVLLRGGVDGMHTIVPEFDPDYKRLRPGLSSGFDTPPLPLSRGFGLHPALKTLHQWYQQKSLLPIVAVSSGYKARSHFDGQDYLESGLGRIDHDNGWLARAIEVNNQKALAVSRTVPISLRTSKPAEIDTWFPSNLKDGNEDLYSALADIYQYHPTMSETLSSGLEVKGLVDSKNKTQRVGKFSELCLSAGKLLADAKGPDCMMLELGGWDTHNAQSNRLNRQFDMLDSGLAQLQQASGNQWQNTLVIVATEFGRTAKENGTKGTDHGTASSIFFAGGAVNGGRVLGEWPGLKPEQLFAKRDLMPTSNMFSWIGNVLQQHWQLTDNQVANIFPHIKPYAESIIVQSQIAQLNT